MLHRRCCTGDGVQENVVQELLYIKRLYRNSCTPECNTGKCCTGDVVQEMVYRSMLYRKYCTEKVVQKLYTGKIVYGILCNKLLYRKYCTEQCCTRKDST